jgi:starvation-inducible DNA-binding protein
MQPKPQTGITGKARDTLAKVLDHVLRDECSLSATTRDYRWKVTGPNLYSLHRLFDEQRRQLDYWLGQVGQLAKSVGFGARDTAEEIKRAADAGPGPSSAAASVPPSTMIGDLLARHEVMAQRLRADIESLGDPATAELLTRLVEFHETTAWMLRMLHNGPGSDQTA